MITPKEKAEELVNFFNKLPPAKLSDYTRIYWPSAKRCALKVCQEIIEGYEFDSLDIEHKRIMDNINFWDEVKKEIEKI